MNDRDVLIVEQYISECITEPSSDESKFMFDFHAYSSWAAERVLERVICEASKLPPHISGEPSQGLLEVIEEFIEEMEDCKEEATTDTGCRIFEICVDEGVAMLFYADSCLKGLD